MEQVVSGPTDACWVCLGAQKQEVRLGHWGVFEWLGGQRAGCGHPARESCVCMAGGTPGWLGGGGDLGHSHRTIQRCRCLEGDFREV